MRAGLGPTSHTPHRRTPRPPRLPLQVVSKDIRRILAERARYFGIILDDVSITQVGGQLQGCSLVC